MPLSLAEHAADVVGIDPIDRFGQAGVTLARERGIPMVLGVLDATSRIPDGSQVAVDGVAGIVRWIT